MRQPGNKFCWRAIAPVGISESRCAGERVRAVLAARVEVVLRFAIFIFAVEAMAMRNSIFAVSAALLSFAVPLFAHHGNSVFDMTKTITLKGSVTEWDWYNPHCLLQFDVKDEGGQAVHWIVETQNPANMVLAGWGKASFKPGDEISVTLAPAKNGKPFGRIHTVLLPSGKMLDADKGDAPTKDSGDYAK
jgi:hypothetical protein